MLVSCVLCRKAMDVKQFDKHPLSKSCDRNLRWLLNGKSKSGKAPKCKICVICNKTFYKRRSNYCSNSCSKQYMTEELRAILSDKRKKYLKENADKHPWKRHEKYKSVPCEIVKEYLRESSIKFVEEWNPIPDRLYALDIAFPDIKLGVEINGNQHYERDGTLKPYYRKRHDEIVGFGWTLLELHYSIAFNLDKLKILLDIKEQPDYSEYFKIKESKIKSITLPSGIKNRKNGDIKWKDYKEKVVNSEIDFSKWGWSTEVSKILGITPQNVKKWMKRHLPDFYESKCFKRKSR